MDSYDKDMLFNTIRMSLLLGYNNAARYVFYDALQLNREEAIEECIDLALKRDSIFLAKDFENIKGL